MNRNRKLTPDSAKELWLTRGQGTQKQRAERFGVSVGLVASLDSGRCWNSVTGLENPDRPREVVE